MWAWVVLLVAVVINIVHGDVYMANMRGSNNRVNGKGRDRTNGNRLFDSQNNARGGYNSGPGMSYYVGSILQLEYTSQHTCGERNSNCELVLQYMCNDKIRDGGNEKTIPEKVNSDKCEDNNCDTDFQFGMHENHEWYEKCKQTQRNHRLYTANQNLQTHTAKTTRQNNNGQRRGLECPEEKDYWPYWRPSPWKDVAVMTGDLSRCDYYQQESQNVKDRYYCHPPPGYVEYLREVNKKNRHHRGGKNKFIPITEEECKELRTPGSTDPTLTGVWTRVPAHGIAAPDCVQAPPSRDNHNGNGPGGYMNTYNWIIPDDINRSCVLRLRYNISTNDFAAWDTNSRDNGINNDQGGPKLQVPLGMHERTAQSKGYYHRTNPVVEPFRVLVDGQDVGKRFKLRLAFNTAQFGRTFQDRSHAFSIIPRPPNVPANTKIVNLNVRGKRGNIVQTYPAMEYDFVPQVMNVESDTLIHVQWTGADTNPNNNAGQGRAGTDRNNICLLGANRNHGDYPDQPDVYGRLGTNFPADLRNGTNIFGVDDITEYKMCTVGTINGDNDNGELDNMPQYYNQDLVRCKIKGVWHYLCTRNNNFTNRSQKGKLICE